MRLNFNIAEDRVEIVVIHVQQLAVVRERIVRLTEPRFKAPYPALI